MLQSLDGKDVSLTLDRWLNSKSGFDQCGAMYGQIIVDESVNETERNTIEVNLPGVRRVRYYDAKQISSNSEQRATVIGVGQDGTVFVLSSTIIDECNEYILVLFLISHPILTHHGYLQSKGVWIRSMGEW